MSAPKPADDPINWRNTAEYGTNPGYTFLMDALDSTTPQVQLARINAILNAGADPEIFSEPNEETARSYHWRSRNAVHLAANLASSVEVIDSILTRNGQDTDLDVIKRRANTPDTNGDSPLMIAAYLNANGIEVVQAFLDHGADATYVNPETGENAITIMESHTANLRSKTELLQKAMERAASAAMARGSANASVESIVVEDGAGKPKEIGGKE